MSLQVAIDKAVAARIAEAHGISKFAVHKWKSAQRLPYTEHLPAGHPRATRYWQTIQKLAAKNGYRISKATLLGKK